MKYLNDNGTDHLIDKIKIALDSKYDKSGGEITGNVKIDGTLTLDIEDEDYDAGITFNKRLDDNLGTVLTLTGYANANNDNTNYKPIIRNIGTPNQNYDVANKKYVDDNIVRPSSYLVLLNNDGTIDTYSSNLKYEKVKAELTSYTSDVYLDVIYNTSRLHISAMQDMDTNAGPIVFMGEIRMPNGDITEAVFLLDSSDNLTVTYSLRENALYKTNDIETYASSLVHYPTTKGVWDTFQRKPVVVWETSTPADYLKAVQSNLSASPAWQLTNLDMTPFKRIKIYSCAGQKSGTTASASTTPAIILEMSLDSRNAISAYGGNYVGSVLVQKPNDANRYASLTCAVSADKTKFVVLRQSSLYGTAATGNDDVNANVFMIEGYYD